MVSLGPNWGDASQWHWPLGWWVSRESHTKRLFWISFYPSTIAGEAEINVPFGHFTKSIEFDLVKQGHDSPSDMLWACSSKQSEMKKTWKNLKENTNVARFMESFDKMLLTLGCISFWFYRFARSSLTKTHQFFFAVRSDSEQTKSWWDVHLPSCWMCLPTVSYGPSRIISTYKTPFIECIIPVITSFN